MNADWWHYDQLPSGEPYDWHEPDASRGTNPIDLIDFHLDIGCGLAKKARLGIDRFNHPDVDLAIDLETLTPVVLDDETHFLRYHQATEHLYDLQGKRGFRGHGDFRPGLPFPTGSIKSIITHHALEHVGPGFIRLMDECHRVLEMGGVMRIIVPLFPSTTAVEDPDHKRYFMENTLEAFCGAENGAHWHESFSKPYTTCRFKMVDRELTERSPDFADWWTPIDRREMRVALRKHVEEAVDAGHDVGELQAGGETDLRDDDAVGRAAVAERSDHPAGVSAQA